MDEADEVTSNEIHAIVNQIVNHEKNIQIFTFHIHDFVMSCFPCSSWI